MRKQSGFLGMLLVAIAAASAMGCGSNACEDADARYEECGLTTDTHTQDCSGIVECWASCKADADCETLIGTHRSPDYDACIADCKD